MDIITYALCKKIASGAVSGIKDYTIDGLNFIMTTNDGQELKITFPDPSPKNIDLNNKGQIVFELEDGTILTTETGIPEAKVSKEEGNALKIHEDGLYVPKGNVEISQEEGNALVGKEDGLFVQTPEPDYETATSDAINSLFNF